LRPAFNAAFNAQKDHRNMRKLIVAGVLAAGLAAPAFAEDTTLSLIVAKGVTLSIMGMEVPVKYNADGTFVADVQGQQMGGKWRIDGDKMCQSSDMQPEERCQAYPVGKKAGESFDLETEMGPMTIKINE
jgi:hypothetical protein